MPSFTILAGFPAITQCSVVNGFVTNDLKPTIQSFGICAPFKNVVCIPNQQWSPIKIGAFGKFITFFVA